MKIIKQLLIILIITHYSCKNEIKKIENVNDNNHEKLSVNKKYIVLKYTLNIPSIKHTESSEFYNEISNEYIKHDGINYVDWEKKLIVGEIQEFEYYSDEIKYKLFDAMDNEINFKFKMGYYSQDSYVLNNSQNSNDIEELRRNNKSKIEQREIKIFDSYKDASIYKRQFN